MKVMIYLLGKYHFLFLLLQKEIKEQWATLIWILFKEVG